MSLFTIDEDKCTQCGICARSCPTQVIECAADDAIPTLIPGAEPFCIECGHCVTVCPTQAMNHSSSNPSECDTIRKHLIPDDQGMQEFLKSRRSIRKFKDRPVDRKTIESLVDIGRYAPTGSNKQEVCWTVFDESRKINTLSSLTIDWAGAMAKVIPDKITARKMERLVEAWDKGQDKILHKAPAVILVHGQKDLPLIQTDCIIALTYLELFAATKGLGTCWAGYFTNATIFHPALYEKINLPENHTCFGAVMVGYPQYKYSLIPKRNPANITWG